MPSLVLVLSSLLATVVTLGVAAVAPISLADEIEAEEMVGWLVADEVL